MQAFKSGHVGEDERDDSEIRALPEPEWSSPEFPAPGVDLAPRAAPNAVAEGHIAVSVACRPLPSEAVPNCRIRIGSQSAKANRLGQAILDLSSLPDGTYDISVEGEETWDGPVGPEFRPGVATKRVWRRLAGQIIIKGRVIEGAIGEGLTAIGGNLRVALQPVWLRAPLASNRSGPVDMIVIHHTGGKLASDLNTFLYSNRVSIHYLVAPNGDVYKLVNEDRKASHAGYSHWQAQDNMNGRSIGIEMTHKDGDYPEPQLEAVVTLVEALHRAFPGIPAGRIIGHSDIGICEPSARSSCIPPAPKRLGRKSTDPGSAFPWERIEALGLGLQIHSGDPAASMFGGYFVQRPGGVLKYGDNDEVKRYGGEHVVDVDHAIHEVQSDLSRIGYYCGSVDGDFGKVTQMAVRMFNQHMFSGSRRRNASHDDLDIDAARIVKRVLGEVTPPPGF